MNLEHYLQDIIIEFEQMKKLADNSISQVTEFDFFKTIDTESNSIALIIKHISGNQHSRWRNFLTTDGEKPNRNRDTEFIITDNDSMESIMSRWENGWEIMFNTLKALTPGDLDKTITIRNKPAKVFQALHRQMTHYAEHIGQIILLAKCFCGANWKTLSIAKGKSEEFNQGNKDSFQNKKLK